MPIILSVCLNNTKPYLYTGAFYYMLGNIRPELRSKISGIQLLLLVNYTSVAEFGIDRMLQPIVEDLRKLESVSCFECHLHLNTHTHTHITLSL